MLLIQNIAQIVTFTNKDRTHPLILYNHSILIDNYGNIEAIKPTSELKPVRPCEIIDGSDQIAIPGFIDAHTHPVWAGDRVDEWKAKIAGKSYMEIHKLGGGIQYTVKQTELASEQQLLESLRERCHLMSSSGTTTIEAKTGYGLTWENELKMLKVLQRAKSEFKFMDISITYCGAHAIPPHSQEALATDDIVNNQLPRIRELNLSGYNVSNIDVFCEKGIFEKVSTFRILKAGEDIGLKANFHADELSPIGGAELVRQLKRPSAVSHLEQISDDGIEAMADTKSVAVILPTTAYVLKLPHPPVRKLLDNGVRIAIGTDFNPNVYCTSMPITMHLTCTMFNVTLEEALAAATINAAESIGMEKTHGSLEQGKVADMILLNVCRWEDIIYMIGAHTKLISHVIKRGKAL